MSDRTIQKNIIERPPVIVIMGHVDHGKSALLDYIRKSNVVASESGGITQHISAYEIVHNHDGEDKKITFIDTPGHSAFSAMRARGARVADIAVLVVSAEDGVKTQTLEALEAIKTAKIPFIIAINKIDLPNANIQTTQSSLIENGIYIEGMGGDIPWVAISAKTGEGVDELLDTMILVAEMEELKGDVTKRATGVVIESHRDNKRGVTATLIIKDGTLKIGQYIVSGNAMTPVRLMEDFLGKKIDHATFSSPISLIGFDNVPEVGSNFTVFDSKKDATLARSTFKEIKNKIKTTESKDGKFIMPVIIKADTIGSVEAIEFELEKLESDLFSIKILDKGVGGINEGDVKTSITTKETVILGFNSEPDAMATEVARQYNIQIKNFSIIYELTDWLNKHINEIRPKVESEEVVGNAKILANFNSTKNLQTVGGTVLDGQIRNGNKIKIYTYNNKLKGDGKIITLQSGKNAVDNVNKDQEFGTQIESDIDIEKGDTIECLETVLK